MQTRTTTYEALIQEKETEWVTCIYVILYLKFSCCAIGIHIICMHAWLVHVLFQTKL